MIPRTGRPTDNPRPNKISIRISDADKKILEDYCEQESVNKTEAISRGIKRLENDIKKRMTRHFDKNKIVSKFCVIGNESIKTELCISL